MAVQGSVRRLFTVAITATLLAVSLASVASADLPTPDDPRVGLGAGLEDAEVAAKGMELQRHLPKPAGFSDPANPGSIAFANSDLAFQGDHAFVGNFNGFNIYDVSDPAAPQLTTSVVCPGGQGDLSVYGNLLFMSVEENRAKTDCTLTPPATAETRFRGVRIFDISDLSRPVQVAAVQTCRGSHTHTLVTDPDDGSKVYIYVQGTAGVRAPTELTGCNGTADPTQPNPSRWRIEVIEVPLAAPQAAQVVNEPRLFLDEQTGRIDGLQNAPQTPLHPSGIPWGPTPTTDSCHDITVYPEIELAAGACEGNGLLIDISDPANPTRLDAVADPLYAYWHGATFSNDGKTVMFTDEWGGGVSARCRAADDLSWGGNAIYDIVDGKLVFRSYYKVPMVQTDQENCVSHIPSLVPVPGRDIFVQAWYQGGASLVDFTDSAHPVEIGFFDRGPVDASRLVLSGFWSTYWYNGAVFGSEIGRGFDSLRLTPTTQLSANEIAAAREAVVDRLNVQHQDRLTWQPSFAVVRSYADQLQRTPLNSDEQARLDAVGKQIDLAERQWDAQPDAARAHLRAAAAALPKAAKYDALRGALLDLAES
ncbi:MAG: LVIVD repeat-containing protein [Kribbellaceae bacterium]